MRKQGVNIWTLELSPAEMANAADNFAMGVDVIKPSGSIDSGKPAASLSSTPVSGSKVA
jgi:hypothetical protein